MSRLLEFYEKLKIIGVDTKKTAKWNRADNIRYQFEQLVVDGSGPIVLKRYFQKSAVSEDERI